jgi:hypothetical protein
MSLTTQPAPAKSDTSAAAPQKNSFETVITLTPVVLTVLATVLAGRSVGEMTQAQYHRSVAGQNQSKVGDQWAFFQAKKIRATEMEMTTDRIPISFKPAKLEPYHLQVCNERLQSALADARDRARTLEEAAKSSKDSRLQDALNRFLNPDVDKKKAQDGAQEKLIALLKLEDEKLGNKATVKQSVFAYLDFDPKNMPQPEAKSRDQETQDAVNDPDIKKMSDAIIHRDPEDQIAELAKGIRIERLKLAIDDAELKAQAFSDYCKANYSDTLDDLDRWISSEAKVSADCHLAALIAGNAQGSDLKGPASRFVEADATVQTAAQQLNDLFKSAAHDFNQRRYSMEAANNQKTAQLYEVQVHHSSMLSDNHLERSKMFSYAMMGTQAGVAIASLALAARRKSMLWLLAALLGVAALAYSAWVFKSTMVP